MATISKTETNPIISEADGKRSRDRVTLKSGVNYPAGAVLGQFTSGGDAGKWTVVTPAASDGTQTAAGILLGAVNATAADQPGAVVNIDAEVLSSRLNWGSLNGGQITTATGQLRSLGIKIRTVTSGS